MTENLGIGLGGQIVKWMTCSIVRCCLINVTKKKNIYEVGMRKHAIHFSFTGNANRVTSPTCCRFRSSTREDLE
jgi:hypothetical protein